MWTARPRTGFHPRRPQPRRFMTVCVGFVCDEGKSIVLVADKMVGMGYIQQEPDISKILQLHKDWRLLFAGDDITPVIDIFDGARTILGEPEHISLDAMVSAVYTSYQQQREKMADALYLTPRGWTRQKFIQEGKELLPEMLYSEIESKLAEFEFTGLQLLIAGFDTGGNGHLISLDSREERGFPKRYNVLGFCSIGSGYLGATYMMYYRKCGPKMRLREALYYAVEAKYFGEFASGVGLKTDVQILRHNAEAIILNDEDVIEKHIMKMCDRLSPREMTKKDHEILNTLPGLEGIKQLKERKKKRKVGVDV